MLDAIETLGPDDPAVKALEEKAAPLSVDEAQALLEDERERDERLVRVRAANDRAESFNPDSEAFKQEAYGRARDVSTNIAQAVQGFVRQVWDGKAHHDAATMAEVWKLVRDAAKPPVEPEPKELDEALAEAIGTEPAPF